MLTVTRIYVFLSVAVCFPMLMIWYNKPHDVTTFTPAWAFLVRRFLFVDMSRSSLTSLIDIPYGKPTSQLLLIVRLNRVIDARRCHCGKCPSRLGSLRFSRGRRALCRLLFPGRWLLHDNVLHLHLYSSVCIRLFARVLIINTEGASFGRIMTVR